MSEPTTPPPQKPRGLMMIMLLLFGAMIMVAMLFNNLQPEKVAWSDFLTNVEEGKVTSIEQGAEFLVVSPTKDGGKPYQVLYPGSRMSDTLQAQLDKSIIAYNVRVESGGADALNKPKIKLNGAQPAGPWSSMLPSLLVFALVMAVMYFVFFRRMSQGGGVLSFGKSRAQLVAKGKTGKRTTRPCCAASATTAAKNTSATCLPANRSSSPAASSLKSGTRRCAKT